MSSNIRQVLEAGVLGNRIGGHKIKHSFPVDWWREVKILMMTCLPKVKCCLTEEHDPFQGASRRTCRAAATTSTAKRLPSRHADRLPWQRAPDLPSAEVRRHGGLPQGGDQKLKQYFIFFWTVI